MDKAIREYLRKIGAKGGKKSRRILTTEQSLAMIKAREQKRKRKGHSKGGQKNG